MKKTTKKMIAPVVIVVLMLLYYVGFGALLVWAEGLPWLIKVLGALVPLLLGGVCIYVLWERFKEIRSGEEDDLSQY